VDSALFLVRIREAGTEQPEGRDDEDDGGWDGDTVKKGNPYRRSKRDRALASRLKKL